MSGMISAVTTHGRQGSSVPTGSDCQGAQEEIAQCLEPTKIPREAGKGRGSGRGRQNRISE